MLPPAEALSYEAYLGEVVARGVKVEAGAQRAAQEPWLGEREVDVLADRAELDPGPQVLAAPPEVRLIEAQIDHQLVDR